MLIENNNFAHIIIEHVVICILEKSIQENIDICILEKSIQENTEKRVPIFLINRAFAVRKLT